MHLHFEGFKTKIPDESDRNTKHATVTMKFRPVLFGIHLESLTAEVTVKMTPPLVVAYISITHLGVKCITMTNLTPVAPNKFMYRELIYHLGNFGSKLFAKFLFLYTDINVI